MRERRSTTVVIAALLMLAAPSLRADSTMQQAKALAQKANADYALGRFTEALAGYEKAYELFRAPAFLFNLGQCHKQLKNWDRAIFFFEGYLREQPDAPNRDVVQELIEDSRREQQASLAAESQRREVEAKAAEVKRIQAQQALEAERARVAQQQQQQQQQQRLIATAPPPTVQKPSRPVYKRAWFWVVVGGVAAAAAVGGGLGGYYASKPIATATTLGTVSAR